MSCTPRSACLADCSGLVPAPTRRAHFAADRSGRPLICLSAALMIFVAAAGEARAETNTNNAEAAAAVIQEPITGDMPFSTAGRETEPQAEEYPHIFSTDDWNPLSF